MVSFWKRYYLLHKLTFYFKVRKLGLAAGSISLDVSLPNSLTALSPHLVSDCVFENNRYPRPFLFCFLPLDECLPSIHPPANARFLERQVQRLTLTNVSSRTPPTTYITWLARRCCGLCCGIDNVFEEAKFDALCALDLFKKLGAVNDAEVVRRFLERFDSRATDPLDICID